MKRLAACGPCLLLDVADGAEFFQQLRLGGIELAAVVAEIEFRQVQAKGPGLSQ